MSDLKLPQIFKPEDFETINTDECESEGKETWAEFFARRANHIHNLWIKENGVVVYGQLAIQNHVWNTKNPEWHDTHTGYLIGVQEIEKKCVEHEPSKREEVPTCIHCDKKLKAIWQVIE